MSLPENLCGICQRREAALFMVVRQEERVAKEHVCCTCYELAEGYRDLTVETVSLQEFNEVVERKNGR